MSYAGDNHAPEPGGHPLADLVASWLLTASFMRRNLKASPDASPVPGISQ